MTTSTERTITSRQAFLSNPVIDGLRITIVVTEYNDGWKRREVLLPEGVTMSGHSAQDVMYKHSFPFTKIEFYLFGQRRVCELHCDKPNHNAQI